MNNNTQEKDLIERNESNIFEKVKRFFKNIFRKKGKIENETEENVLAEAEKSYGFREYIREIDNEETELLELQMKYHRGEIADNELTQEQINSLCLLYDKQINDLKKTINAKEIQVAKYKKMERK